jgi:hypothetical protein
VTFMKHRIALALLSFSLAATAACKQGPGDRCQVDADCEDGLTCSQADPKICGDQSNTEPLDASLPEAGTPITDAAVDATVDAQ